MCISQLMCKTFPMKFFYISKRYINQMDYFSNYYLYQALPKA